MFAGSLIKGLSTLIIKSLILLILLAVLPFSYLFLTMESEKELLKGIEESEAFIQSQQRILSKVDYEKEQLSQKIAAMTQRELTRREKIEIMDLNLKIHQLSEQSYKVELEINIHEKKSENMQKRLMEVEKKSFLQRLLRM
jgi:hypothetical protein